MTKKKVIDSKTYAPTPQGMEILEAVCEYGAMTALQLAILLNKKLYYKDGKLDGNRYPEDLVAQLREAGLLETDKRDFPWRPGRKPWLHKLTRKGKEALAALHRGKLSELGCASIDPNLEHFILSNDFRVTLLRAVADAHATTRMEILETFDEHTLRQMHSSDKMTIKHPASPRWPEGREESNVIIVPDYYFDLLITQDKLIHKRRFVEIDRSTEILKSRNDYNDWVNKVLKYRTYTKKGGLCEQRYGTNKVAILTVTNSEKRMHNLKEATEKAGGKDRFWFTSFSLLTPSSFCYEPIWARAGKEGLHAFISKSAGEEEEQE